MVAEQEDVYYYITVMNENYTHPAMPAGAEEGIVRGLYLLREAAPAAGTSPRVQLLGSGTILREVIAAADLLAAEYGVAADVWSATSFNELRRDGLAVERWNMLHPEAEPRVAYVTSALEARPGPVVGASDYMKSYADGIRPFVPRRYHALGTDGFGRSDYRRELRGFFEVDRRYVALAALTALAADGALEREVLVRAIADLGLDPEKPDPVTV